MGNKGKYEDRDDFTVVVQPFFEYTDIPEVDGRSWLAPDCFHFAEKAHDAAAVALWNNMIEPIGLKRTAWTPGEQFECPNKALPYFYTKQNSGPKLAELKAAATAVAAAADDSDLPFAEELNVTDGAPQKSSGSTFGTTLAVVLSVGGVCVLAAVALVVRRHNGRSLGYTAVEDAL